MLKWLNGNAIALMTRSYNLIESRVWVGWWRYVSKRQPVNLKFNLRAVNLVIIIVNTIMKLWFNSGQRVQPAKVGMIGLTYYWYYSCWLPQLVMVINTVLGVYCVRWWLSGRWSFGQSGTIKYLMRSRRRRRQRRRWELLILLLLLIGHQRSRIRSGAINNNKTINCCLVRNQNYWNIYDGWQFFLQFL